MSVEWSARSKTTMRGVHTSQRAIYRDGKFVRWSRPRTVYVPALDVLAEEEPMNKTKHAKVHAALTKAGRPAHVAKHVAAKASGKKSK